MSLHIASKTNLPPESVTETFAILGIRGSGKTNTAVVMAEELLKAKRQVVILDPVDVWWGLKSSKDGKRAGFPIPVIGGEHADVPLDGNAGIVLADFVVDTRASVILSLRQLSMNEQRRFAADFAKRLYERKGAAEHRSPVMLIVDEADEFVPQRIQKGHEAMFGAFDRLVRRGRSSGIGVTLISQRPQVLNKDVLSQMEVLIALRVLHKLEREALKAWTEAHDTEGHQEEFLSSLAGLEKGEGWIWSPSWMNIFQRVKIRERETFDSSATPKPGQQLAPPKEIAPIDLEKLKSKMAAQIEKQKADDPKLLRAEIAKLKAELQKAQTAAPAADASAIAEAEKRGYRRGWAESDVAQRAAIANEWSSLRDKIRGALQDLDRLASEGVYRTPVAEFADDVVLKAPPRPHGTIQVELVKRPKRPPISDAASNFSGAEQRILDALAELEALGVENPRRVQVAFMAGYTNLNSKGFTNAIGSLRTAGYIDYPGPGTVVLTPEGRPRANTAAAPRTGEELRARLVSMLGGASGRIVDALVKAYPRSMERVELASRAGYENLNSKGFTNAIGRLRSLGLIDYPQQGYVRANDLLFLEGR